MPNSVLFPCPDCRLGGAPRKGFRANGKVRNLLCYRGAKDGRFLQQFPPLERKGTSLVVAVFLYVCVFVCMSTCAHVCASVHLSMYTLSMHMHFPAWLLQAYLISFKFLNENVAVNFKLIWMDSNKMQTSLQIRIFSEDF